jgi:pantoate--beta-alanine ligase
MKAVISLGSNLGNPDRNLADAIDQLRLIGEQIVISDFIKTVPVGGPPQDDYLNAVVILQTELTPEDLLGQLQAIEARAGRTREVRWGARTLDLDLIIYGDLVLKTAALEIPHPRAHQRNFVLKPWLQIDPSGHIPGKGSVRDLLDQIDNLDEIAFVPTMGALHEGHLSLIRQARTLSKNVVVSIFVNPLQFNDKKDLENYPRDLVGDTAKAIEAGATRVWAPTYEEVYGDQIETIHAGAIGSLYEGINRPNHFDGVLTVVDRLFETIKPKYAIFGEKDFQQLFIIKTWVKENQIPVEIIAGATVRDDDGLALSSRNIRLTVVDRQAALVINRALHALTRDAMVALLEAEDRFTLDYAEIIDSETFEKANIGTLAPRAIIAGWVNGVRLLDNAAMKTAGFAS